jgi:heptosyltransferase III
MPRACLSRAKRLRYLPSSNMSRTIIIIHLGALGDVLLAVPAIRRLRVRFSQHRLILCGDDSVCRLLLECRVIDGWLSVQGRSCADLFADSASVTGDLRDWLARCDLAVAWTRDQGSNLAATLNGCGAFDVRVLSPFSSTLNARHQRDRFLETLQEPPPDPLSAEVLEVPGHLREQGQAYLHDRGILPSSRLVVVHPGSGSLHKCVGPEVLLPVIKRLKESGALPLVLEGPADQESVSGMLKCTSEKPMVLRDLDLLGLAGVLSQANLFIGQDSGVTHLAAQLGVPTVALFGPTDPARWAPEGLHVAVVKGGTPCRCRSWEAVSRCAEKPCLRLSIEVILATCRLQLQRGATPRKTSRCALSLPTPYAKVTS